MILNQELIVSFPEGFREYDEAELKGYSFPWGMPGLCMENKERRIIFSAAWKNAWIASFILSERDVAENNEKMLRKEMEPLEYHREGFLERELAGRKAYGFRYSYKAQNVDMTGDVYVIKIKKTFYHIYFYTRSSMLEENLPVFEKILSSITVQKQ